MNDSIKLLDKYAMSCQASKDTDIAARLRVTKQTVSGWRNGRAHPNAEAVEKMCEQMGEPLRKWLPLIEAERARTPADKRVWLRLAKAAAAVILVTSFSRLDIQTATAKGLESFSQNQGTVYIMSNLSGHCAGHPRQRNCRDSSSSVSSAMGARV